MVFVDTETVHDTAEDGTQTHRLWFGSACRIRNEVSGGKQYRIEEWLDFTEAETFWKWVFDYAHAKTRTYIYAHNWNFDAGILSTATIPKLHGFVCTRYINEKPPFIVGFRRDKATLLLLDTLNYFSGKLSTIGESIGVPKLDMPSREAPFSEWTAYCRNDVLVIKSAITKFLEFIEEHNLGNYQPTLASQSFTAYRHRFMPTAIFIHSNEGICQLERESYYGGRSECFYLGNVNQPLWYFDVNSLYPSMMSEHPYPMEKMNRVYRLDDESILALLESHCMTARVKVNTPEPVFPVRMNQRLTFPTGKFWVTLSTPELRYAASNNYIIGFDWGSLYKSGYLFRDFVDYFYRVRGEYKASGNQVFDYLCKIFLNSFYGKFGQNGTVWKDTGEETESVGQEWIVQETSHSIPTKFRARLGRVQRFDREGETYNSFPAISAHVTAYGRMHLWSLIKQAGVRNVYYTDTDSLIVNLEGRNNLRDWIHPSNLGSLKQEGTARDASFYGPKDYRFGRVERHKGIRDTAVRVGPNEWIQDTFVSWDVLLSQGKDGIILVKPTHKTLYRQYLKGTRTPSGWVKPYVLNEP